MSKVYSKDEILVELTSVLEKGADCLYNSNIVNWKGCIKDSSTPYTEEIIDELYKTSVIEHCAINNIEEISRENSYYTKSHEELLALKTEGSNREEENYVKSLFFYNPFEAEIGTPIDYQVPLKNDQKDNAGKIDLITFNKDTSELFIVEVKKNASEETALRCCLEVQTYLQKLDVVKFVEDFYNAGKLPTKDFQVKLAVIVFENSVAGADFKDEKRVNLQKLVKDFDIKVCFAK